MLSGEFSASDEELQLSSRLLETNNWHNADTLSVDAAIGIFKQSDLTFKQLRDIWTIADKKGSGSLSKHELAVVIRLMGWVQAGQPLHEDLLASGVLSSNYLYSLCFQKLTI
jgi:epidermal growth factor receptor substrate 15